MANLLCSKCGLAQNHPDHDGGHEFEVIEEEPGNQFDFKCPKCERDDTIEIAASVWVLLTGDGSDSDASEFGDHEWDDDSAARCADCKWSGKVKDLSEPESESSKPEPFFIQPVTVGDDSLSALTEDGSNTSPREVAAIADELVKARDKLRLYRRLADGLSDMVEDSRLAESDIPDDYQWLVESLSQIAVADPS